MCNNNLFKTLLLVVSIGLLVSCDKDYNEVGDGLIGENHFDLSKENFSVLAYNKKIEPVQSNNLPVNALGIYNNAAFGKTTANFATQLSLETLSPVIGNNPEIDEVYIDIPYSPTLISTDVSGNTLYELDSVYGVPKAKIKLSVFESGLYMRDRNPVGGFVQTQPYFTNQNVDFENLKIGSRLNDADDKAQNDEFFFDPLEHKVSTTNPDTKVVTITGTPPSMRLQLNKEFFKNKILKAGASDLVSDEAFKRYFRGLYFKVEQSGSDAGSLAMLNFAKGSITIKYKEDLSTTVAGVVTVTRADKSIILKMIGNSVSLLEKSNPNIDYTNALDNSDSTLGDEKLYLNGGQGSFAVLELFGPDNFGEDGLTGAPNGVADELDKIRKNKWLINQANLVFTIDAASMANSYEPNRLYLYDFTNSSTILDYFIAATTENKQTSKFTFDGFIRKDPTSKKGLTYKINVSNHIRNLVKDNLAKNIKLGLVVAENINIPDFYKLQTPNALFTQVPVTSVMNSLGTILYGGKSTVPEARKLKLEIFYTKPN